MIDSAPERITPISSDPTPSRSRRTQGKGPGRGNGVRLKRKRGFADSMAFLLSAALSPYIVIPVGTVGIVYARTPKSASMQDFFVWAALSLFFSTALPLAYILVGMRRGTISDVHVMEKDQRGAPFVIAIIGGFLAAFLLYLLHAPPSVWGLSVIQAVNGLAILAINQVTKISVHVSVLSATVLGATVLHPPFPPYAFVWLIPLLIWARARRGRHSLAQGIAGFFVSSTITTLVIAGLGLSDRLAYFWQRL